MSQNVKSGAKAPVSRITSFKRDWDDANQDDTPIDWPLSPEPPRKKPAVKAASGPDDERRQRRLQAIQAALGSQSSSSTSSSASPASTLYTANTSVSSASTQATSFSSSRPHRPPSSSKPPSSSATSRQPSNAPDSGSSKTRVLPWEADHSKLKAQAKPVILRGSEIDSRANEKKLAGVFLSQEQKYVLKQAMDGKNVFFTGSAGTGKSVVLREIIQGLKKKYSKKSDAVAITASTGIAACNIGGVTIHSFTGAGLCTEPPDQLVTKVRRNKKAAARWLRTEVLIIDEVSMVDGDLFDKLAKVGQLMKNRAKPFGGIQLIITGDFFQLPPVSKSGQPRFCFEASTWNECIDVTFNLTQVFRQKDQGLVDMLNRMRLGELKDSDTREWRNLTRPLPTDDGIEATELFPRREDVERANKQRMAQLPGQARVFSAIDGGTMADAQQREKTLANFMAPTKLELKVDAQVMLIKNTEEDLVNGSIGRVIGFCDLAAFRGVNEMTGKIEKIEDTFDLNTKEGKKAHERKQRMIEEGRIEDCPVVRFKMPGRRATYMCVQRDVFKIELPNGEVQVSRSQIPLIPAWAMSIHKSQGQTLEKVRIDLGRIFEKGQSYVALSRATTIEGLQVLNFDPKKVQAHPKVRNWYKTLPTLATILNKEEDDL